MRKAIKYTKELENAGLTREQAEAHLKILDEIVEDDVAKKIDLMKPVALSLILFFSINASAGDWRFRAREHYEIHDIETGNVSEKYRGFSNTINFWYEEPFEYAVGLAAGPLLGSAKNEDNTHGLSTTFGEKTQLYTVGIEFKYFLYHSLPGLFTRLGTGWSQLRSKGILKKSNGYSGYVGLGWEYPFKYFSMAPEIAIRQSQLQNNITVMSITPSIGIHFHKSPF